MADVNLQIKTLAWRTFSLCVLPYLWVAANSWHTFTGYSLLYISTGVVLNSVLLAATTAIASSTARHVPRFAVTVHRLVWLSAATLITVSFVYNFLVFMRWNQGYKLAVLPIVFGLALAATGHARAFRAITTGLWVAVLLAGTQTVVRAIEASPSNQLKLVPPHALEQGQRSQRNIYLLMFDAMSESSYFASTFGQPPPWQTALLHKGFRESANARSSRPYSMQSVIDVLQERPMPWSEFGDTPNKESADLTIDSPSAGIARAHRAGYRVAFLYQNNYFGALHPIRNLDAYEPERSVGLCSLAPIRVGLHLCRGTQELIGKWTGQEDEVVAHHRATKNFILKAARDTSAWIVWSYIAAPEHTSLTYRDYIAADKAEFTNTHRQKSRQTTEMIEAYLALIKAHDPGAVVVIFGDHGMHRSRGWSSDAQVRELFPPGSKELDERGIGFFMKPAGFCANRIGDSYRLERLLTDLMACVAEYPPETPP